jgi:predicted lipoprotein with Yx(FWY)xxD motif
MRGTLVIGMALATATVVAGCGGDSRSAAGDGQSSSMRPSQSSRPPGKPTPDRDTAAGAERSRQGREVKVAGSDFGPMLFDRSGQAIYLFDKEATSTPRCYGACAKAWPPVLTRGSPQGSGGVRDSLLGTTPRKDGSRQVTYAGHPLYFYAHEGKNEVLCHNVSEFGGLWLVVTPSGAPAA